MKDYYQILDLNPKDSNEKIKSAYKFLATKYHPDKHNDDPFFLAKFQEIQEAFEILSDYHKRKDYDTIINEANISQNPIDYIDVNNIMERVSKLWGENLIYDALSELRDGIKLFPNNSNIKVIEGKILDHLGDFRGAIKVYKKASNLGDKEGTDLYVDLLKKKNEVEGYMSDSCIKPLWVLLVCIPIAFLAQNPILGAGISILVCSVTLIIYVNWKYSKLSARNKMIIVSGGFSSYTVALLFSLLAVIVGPVLFFWYIFIKFK